MFFFRYFQRFSSLKLNRGFIKLQLAFFSPHRSYFFRLVLSISPQRWYHWIYFSFSTFSINIIIRNKSILLVLTFSRRWVSRCWNLTWFFSWFAFNRYLSQFSSHFFNFREKYSHGNHSSSFFGCLLYSRELMEY